MASWLRSAWIALALGACGNVSSDSPPDAARAVACNGGPVDVLPNGNFDATDPPWRQEPPSILCSQRIMPHSGTTAACFGGGGDNTINTLTREIALPAGASSARLNGFICIATDETADADNDILTFDLLDGVAPIGSLGRRSNRGATAACTFAPFMLETQLSRDPVMATFRMQSTLNIGNSTSFYVDSLTLTVACD